MGRHDLVVVKVVDRHHGRKDCARVRGPSRAWCHVATHDMHGASNGVATGEGGGYLKLVFEGGTEQLLGAQMVSYRAAELIQLVSLVIRERTTAARSRNSRSIRATESESSR